MLRASRRFATLIASLALLGAATVRGEVRGMVQPPTEQAATEGEGAASTSTPAASPEDAEVEAEPERPAEGGAYGSSAPPSVWGFCGPRPGRIGVSLGGGWPGAWLSIDYGATERLGVGLDVAYFYGLPTSGLGLASGVSVSLPTRLSLLRRSRLEVALDVAPGVVVALDHRVSVVAVEPENEEDEGFIPSGQVRPIGTHLGVGVTVSWRLVSAIDLKLGFQIPATLVLVMADRPYEDTWELAVPFAARAGVVWRALEWLGLFAVVDVGPSLMVTPSDWTAEGYEHEVGVDVFLRVSAGVTFAPWP